MTTQTTSPADATDSSGANACSTSLGKGDHLESLAAFVTATPPIIHNRESYRSPCIEGCKACAYLRLRYRALDSLTSLQSESK